MDSQPGSCSPKRPASAIGSCRTSRSGALLVCVSGISIRGLSGLSAQVVLLAKFACALLLAVACFGVWHDWRIAPFPDLNFAGYAQRLEQAPQGEMLVIPENPPGWKIVLTKR